MKNNSSGSPNELFDKIVKISWLYQKVFWKELLTDLIYDDTYEESKRMLSEVYWYNNIDDIFWKKIKRDEFKKISKIIFKFYEGNGNNKE